MAILRITYDAMVRTKANQMIANRLAVNATKTQVMCLRTKQQKKQMLKAGGEYDLKLTIKGKEIPEKNQRVLLGLNSEQGQRHGMDRANGKDNREI